MIRSLEGTVLSKTEDSIVLDVNGMGFEIFCSGMALQLTELGVRARLITYLQISENGIYLFGFADDDERDVFLRLTSIKGVGGKLALTVLRSLSASEVINAVLNSDQATFTSVPGIGKKTAERICFELHRFFDESMITSKAVPRDEKGIRSTVISALHSLGFPNTDITRVMRSLQDQFDFNSDVVDEGQVLKAALKELNRN